MASAQLLTRIPQGVGAVGRFALDANPIQTGVDMLTLSCGIAYTSQMVHGFKEGEMRGRIFFSIVPVRIKIK